MIHSQSNEKNLEVSSSNISSNLRELDSGNISHYQTMNDLQDEDLLELKIYENRLGFPNLCKLRWRVDIIISTGTLSRVMRPNITFQVTKK